jgi:hypothetical protein
MKEHLDYAEQVVDKNAGHKFTRGHGLLEPFLARQRAKIANRLIRTNCVLAGSWISVVEHSLIFLRTQSLKRNLPSINCPSPVTLLQVLKLQVTRLTEPKPNPYPSPISFLPLLRY